MHLVIASSVLQSLANQLRIAYFCQSVTDQSVGLLKCCFIAIIFPATAITATTWVLAATTQFSLLIVDCQMVTDQLCYETLFILSYTATIVITHAK